MSLSRRTRSWALMGALVGASVGAQAEPRVTQPWWGFVTVDPGFQTFSTSLPGEVGKKGFNFGFNGTLGYYAPRWVADVGAGFRYSRFSGDSGDLVSKSGTADLGARYRLGDWQVGPHLKVLYGGDNTFTEADAESSSMLFLAGLQVHRDLLARGPWLSRVGFRLDTDLNLKSQQVWLFSLVLDFGHVIPMRNSTPETEVVEETPVSIAPVAVTPPAKTAGLRAKRRAAPLPPAVPLPTVINFGAAAPAASVQSANAGIPKVKVWATGARQITVQLSERMLFGAGTVALNKTSREFLSQLAVMLVDAPENWKALRVVGHSDNKVDDAAGQQFSNSRAKAVRQRLKNDSVPGSKMTAVGVSKSEPISNGEEVSDHTRNRRVDLKFSGVQDTELFMNTVNSIPE